MTPKVSVIVPVYNAEPYLHRCLDSILNQTFIDFEVILVDDGSTDKSTAICDEYTVKDDRFRVIHQTNSGVSAARQAGLDAATGEYVIHADPDDWVESDWLLCLYEETIRTNADMVICDFERVLKDKVVYYEQKPSSLDRKDVLYDLIKGEISGVCWNKLIRRDCFLKYDVHFQLEMSLWEDLYVMCSLLMQDISISYISKMLYHYDTCSNDSSIIRFRKDDHIRSCMFFINTFEPILNDAELDDAWYRLKSYVKKRIFLTKGTLFSLKKTFPEINDRYISEKRKQNRCSIETFILMGIRGYQTIAVCLFSQSLVIWNWRKKLQSVIKSFVSN